MKMQRSAYAVSFVIGLALASIAPPRAAAITTTASASGKSKFSSGNLTQSGNSNKSTYTLGQNRATFGNGSSTSGPNISAYTGSSTIQTSQGGGSNSASAISTMSVGPSVNGFYPWDLTLTATVSRANRFSRRGSAQATGTDPQFFDTSGTLGIFEETFALGSGSMLVVEDESFDKAAIEFRRFTSLASGDIWNLKLIATSNGGIAADVNFNVDPRFQFSTSSELVEDLLEGAAREEGLGSIGGLLTELDLFAFSMDLSTFSPGPDDFLGMSGDAATESVPEPRFIAFLLGSGIVVAMWWRGWRAKGGQAVIARHLQTTC